MLGTKRTRWYRKKVQPEKQALILRDTLAIDRTRLANQRTFLAFFRTGLSLIVTALAIIEFKKDSPDYIFMATVLMIFGAIIMVGGLVNYYVVARRIHRAYDKDDAADSSDQHVSVFVPDAGEQPAKRNSKKNEE